MSQVFPIIPAPAKALWGIGAIALILLLSFGFCGYLTYSLHHVRVELSPTELQIRGDFYGRKIPLTTLVPQEAQTLNLRQNSAYKPKWRTNGIGLPGYQSGWFKLVNGEKALMFVTDPQQVIYLPTQQGYVLLMSVENTDEFLKSLYEVVPF
ncbi:PH domain-containing protein [Lusitaniella coriacea]|uniref:PH domain-containing protein n=1 Tax=Lusitaniella coriacea TaxID=1983105 RepID=UPI003CF1901C